jgi:hypothetical protein
MGKDFTAPLSYVLTQKDFDQNDFRDISFFPTHEKRVFRLHAQARGKPFPTYPFLMAFRGCPFHCTECCGAPKYQNRIFGRSWVVRSPERLREDLESWDADPRISYVNIYHDFVCLLPMAYTRTVLGRAYGLSVYYDFFRCPTPEQLDSVIHAFADGVLIFELDQYHANSKEMAPVDELMDRIKTVYATGRFDVRLTFNRHFLRSDTGYAAILEAVVRETGVSLYNGDFWWEHNPWPGEDGWGNEDDYLRCRRERGRRYRVWNTIYRVGTLVHRYFPRLAKHVAGVWFKL